ncbi:MAG: N-acetylneuraminate synthase family protein [Actinomycetes bacterium]
MLLERDVAQYLVLDDEPVEGALRRITANRSRVVFVVTGEGVLVGSLTDGDFRRWVVSTDTPSLQSPCAEVANRNCRTAREGAGAALVDGMFGDGVDIVPVLDDRRRVVAVARPRTKSFAIGGRGVSSRDPAFIIAEIGINHNGSLDAAKRLVDAAATAGADCAKFQMRDMEALYRSGTAGMAGEDLGVQYTLDLLAESSLTNEEMFAALDYTRECGLVPLCTPWDVPTARLLSDFGLPGFKVASADLTNHELLGVLGAVGRPLIVSTGMSTEAEIIESAELLRSMPSPFALLHCNSAYPSPYKDVQLRYMDRLAELGECLVGYSGHERGSHVVIAAVARGAAIVEKHITLDRRGRGNDHVVSLEPDEFGSMVMQVRNIEEAMGTDRARSLTQGEQLNRLSLAKSLVASTDLPAGHVVTEVDLEVRSPGRGLQPNAKPRLLGLALARAVRAGDFFYDTDLKATVGPRAFTFDRPWGLPVRFHDYPELLPKSNPDFLEFHLSYRDMEMDLDLAVPEALDLDLTVHSPDLFHNDHILDLASDDEAVRDRSIADLQKVVNLTRALKPRFARASRPIVIVSMGGSSMHSPLPVADRPRLYERVASAVQSLDAEGVEIVAQTLPPFPWYLGGQRFCNLFVDPTETAAFSRDSGIRLCLDVSHTKLACTYLKVSFRDAVDVLAPISAHLHLVDAVGDDGEGLQIGDGDIDWVVLAEQLNRLAPGASFIPEIWQGHVGGGQGFWTALHRLEPLLGSGRSTETLAFHP